MKTFKRIILIAVCCFFALSLVACNFGGGGTTKPGGKDDNKKNTKEQTPTDIKKISNLTDYGARAADFNPNPVQFSDGKYANKDASSQVAALQERIEQKKLDVQNGTNKSSFVKIFAMSTPEEIMARMGKAALNYDEMERTVGYMSGAKGVNPNVEEFMKQEDGGSWSGSLTSKSWREVKNSDNKDLNTGWSLFDDIELYEKLKDYASDKSITSNQDKKDLADDNVAWHYRSMLKKIYEDVKLEGATAARLVTHMLDYAVEIVESKSNGQTSGALAADGSYGDFAKYCMYVTKDGEDPFNGLGDYETLSYLLAFDEYYGRQTNNSGLSKCVTLYGYYYDYNKRYYEKSLKDEDTYAKQLKYEKMETFEEAEWLDYVSIQRNNYINAYRYDETFYQKFYKAHFGFQSIIENKDSAVYKSSDVRRSKNLNDPGTTYTDEMIKAIQQDGLKGQLALSDWIWSYASSEQRMKEYNAVNTEYQNGNKSSNSETKNKGKFYYEKQQLDIVIYLLQYMKKFELDGALYYNVYAYSASMVKSMDNNIKDIVYIEAKVKEGNEITTIPSAIAANEENDYAIGKTGVLYIQAESSWRTTEVKRKADDAKNQSWSAIKEELEKARDYDYDQINDKNTKWKKRVERLEELVIARKWSCCGTPVGDESQNKDNCQHIENKDGTAATKEYDTNHKTSLFASDYEKVLYHIAGQSNITFKIFDETKGVVTYQLEMTSEDMAATTKKWNWTTGYHGTLVALRTALGANTGSASPNLPKWKEEKKFGISSGKTFIDGIGTEGDDFNTWTGLKDGSSLKALDPVEITESVNNTKTFLCRYTYKFSGWYLDEECKYEFSEDDNVNFSITVYAGYDIEKVAS